MSALADLARLHGLRKGWSGPESRAPAKTALWRAREMVRAVMLGALAREREWLEPVVAPRPDGGVDLGWMIGDDLLLCTVPGGDEGGVWLQQCSGVLVGKPVRVERGLAVEHVGRLLPPLVAPREPRQGTFARGEGHHAALYPDAMIRQLREEHQAGASPPEIARRHRMNKDWVRDVVNGKRRLAAGGPIAGREEAG